MGFEKMEEIVVSIFKNAGDGLTNNELIKNYTLYVDNLPANTVTEKVKISAVHQSLKARRNNLTHKGLLKKLGERKCSISNNLCEYYAFVGTEDTELTKLQNELERRKEDLTRITDRIAVLEALIKCY